LENKDARARYGILKGQPPALSASNRNAGMTRGRRMPASSFFSLKGQRPL
jgi:hypothetical protein